MAVVLITGNPGSGKTELARELSRLGCTALDTDDIAHWETTDGRPAQAPAEAMTHEWLRGHRWVWGRARVAAVIDQHRPGGSHLFLCGIAIDQEELFDLFDVVFLLSIDERTQVDRLDAPSNADRNAAQRRQIIEGRPVFEQRMRAAGAVALDGSTPTPVLAVRVLAEVEQRFPPAAAGRGGSTPRETPAAAFRAGRVIQRREILHGRVWMAHPVTVVDDRVGVLAVLLEPGSVFAFPEHPFGPHPWSAHPAWSGPTVLQLHRDGDPYSVWKFFTDGVFTHWYVNLEAPVVRHPDGTGGGGFNTADHGIDIVVPADGPPWRWKDTDDPETMAAAGRITTTEAGQIHAVAAAIAARLDADDRWWAPWDTWRLGDPVPRLPTTDRR